MKPLIDADILLYEIGFASQSYEYDEQGNKVVVPRSWDQCQKFLDDRIELICDEVGAKEKPLLFMTNTNYINNRLNKRRKFAGERQKKFIPNFREEIAKAKEYKGGRKSEKPFHFRNLINHILSEYDYFVNDIGLEADDAMCIMQYRRKGDTVICSRDKDVRQVRGLHYSWECGKQPSLGPIEVDELGWMERNPKNGKIFATGHKLFYYQMLAGDDVDNIGGVFNKGPQFSYKLLKDATSERELYQLVGEVYVKSHDDVWETNFREQADLLWMIRELNKGKPVRWSKPNAA